MEILNEFYSSLESLLNRCSLFNLQDIIEHQKIDKIRFSKIWKENLFRFRNSYLSQNWLAYQGFTRSKKPGNRFKIIESHALLKFCMSLESKMKKNPSKIIFEKSIYSIIRTLQLVNPSYKRQLAYQEDIFFLISFL